MKRCLAALVALLISSAVQARADWDTGYDYQIILFNVPVDAVTNVTFDQTEKTVSSNLTVKETIIPSGPNSWWVQLDFQTIDGGPLATDIDGSWSISVDSLKTTGQSFVDSIYLYWSANGTPASSLLPLPGYTLEPIPSNPGAGDAYVVKSPPVGPLPTIQFGADLDEYGPTLIGLGMDPQLINGFHFGIHLMTIPAPSPLTLGSIGLVAVGLLKRPRFRPVEAA